MKRDKRPPVVVKTTGASFIIRCYWLSFCCGFVFSPGHQVIHLLGSGLVSLLQEMKVDFAGGGCIGMTQAAGNLPDIGAFCDQERGRCVACAVEI